MSVLGDFFPESFKDDFARRNLQNGTVLKLHVKNTSPPKEKRFIVVGKTIDGVCLATVFINSAINTDVNFSEELRQLHCLLPAAGRVYLEHDSFVDCSTIYVRGYAELYESLKNRPEAFLGVLDTKDLRMVRSTFVRSPKIKSRDKKRFGFFAEQ
jgi:hypothetical protein